MQPGLRGSGDPISRNHDCFLRPWARSRPGPRWTWEGLSVSRVTALRFPYRTCGPAGQVAENPRLQT